MGKDKLMKPLKRFTAMFKAPETTPIRPEPLLLEQVKIGKDQTDKAQFRLKAPAAMPSPPEPITSAPEPPALPLGEKPAPRGHVDPYNISAKPPEPVPQEPLPPRAVGGDVDMIAADAIALEALAKAEVKPKRYSRVIRAKTGKSHYMGAQANIQNDGDDIILDARRRPTANSLIDEIRSTPVEEITRGQWQRWQDEIFALGETSTTAQESADYYQAIDDLLRKRDEINLEHPDNDPPIDSGDDAAAPPDKAKGKPRRKR